MANTLFLRLEGPLQSWGERAHWSVRDTSSEPTKSGIVGLLACAAGLFRDEELQRLSARLKMGVRCDRPGTLLLDFHTVVGGVLAANGKIKRNANTRQPETVVSWRYYLSDASFLVALQSEEVGLIDELAGAVQNPVWPVYLGRKSCPPGSPLYSGMGQFASLLEALSFAPLDARQPVVQTGVRAVIESAYGEGILRRDEIGSHSRRTFLPRYTRDVIIQVPDSSEV